MWTRISIKDFRLLRDVSIDIEPGKPVVLIGPNASGKSSVLQTLALLHRCAEIGHDDAAQELGDFVSGSSIATQIDVRFTSSKAAVEGADASGDVELRYSLKTGGGLLGERLVTCDRDGIETEKVSNLLSNDELRLTNCRTGALDVFANEERRLSFEMVRQPQLYPYLGTLRAIFLGIRSHGGFSTAPIWERDATESKASVADGAPLAPSPILDRRGLNLVNVLYHLKNSDGSGAWQELLSALQAEFPFVKDLVFPAEPGGRIHIGWWDSRYPKHPLSAHDMSEGMLSYLCLLAAILSSARTTALVFDEPDRHLHPSALRRVVSLIERASEKTAVILATHSDRLLDMLSDPAGSIRVCMPTPDGVRLERLDRGTLEAWKARYSMSTLRARGHLDPSNADLDLRES